MPTTKTAHTPGSREWFAGEYEQVIAELRAQNAALLEAANLIARAGEHFKAGARDGATMGEISLAIDAALAAIKKATE